MGVLAPPTNLHKALMMPVSYTSVWSDNVLVSEMWFLIDQKC